MAESSSEGGLQCGDSKDPTWLDGVRRGLLGVVNFSADVVLRHLPPHWPAPYTTAILFAPGETHPARFQCTWATSNGEIRFVYGTGVYGTDTCENNGFYLKKFTHSATEKAKWKATGMDKVDCILTDPHQSKWW